MRTTMKKLLCLCLSGLMLTGMVACGETTDDPADDTKDTSAATVAEGETEDPAYSLSLDPGLKYNKDQVSILYPETSSFSSEIYIDRLGSGVVADSVYERNLAVEERLNVKMQYNEDADVIGRLGIDQQIVRRGFSPRRMVEQLVKRRLLACGGSYWNGARYGHRS